MTVPLPHDDLACRRLVELVTEHLEGALDPGLERRVLEHLAVCEGCTEHVQQVRTTIALARALPQEEVPAALLARLTALHRQQASG